MADKNKVLFTDDQRAVKIPSGTRLLLRRCCHAVLIMEGFTGSTEISVRFVDNETIHEMNRQYRNVDSATDVLSFPLGENGVYDVNPDTGAFMLGDVVISVERAVEQAKEFGHSFDREMAYLTVHSVLHLLGYDHVNGGLEAVRMREKEETVLSQLDLKRNGKYSLSEE